MTRFLLNFRNLSASLAAFRLRASFRSLSCSFPRHWPAPCLVGRLTQALALAPSCCWHFVDVCIVVRAYGLGLLWCFCVKSPALSHQVRKFQIYGISGNSFAFCRHISPVLGLPCTFWETFLKIYVHQVKLAKLGCSLCRRCTNRSFLYSRVLTARCWTDIVSLLLGVM